MTSHAGKDRRPNSYCGRQAQAALFVQYRRGQSENFALSGGSGNIDARRLIEDGRGWGLHPSAAPDFARCGWRSGSSNPVPAGNCKLQTLRLRLPERGAHTALGDVGTVADLFATVLRPIEEQRGLETWEQLAAYAAEEWVPSRIASVTASR